MTWKRLNGSLSRTTCVPSSTCHRSGLAGFQPVRRMALMVPAAGPMELRYLPEVRKDVKCFCHVYLASCLSSLVVAFQVWTHISICSSGHLTRGSALGPNCQANTVVEHAREAAKGVASLMFSSCLTSALWTLLVPGGRRTVWDEFQPWLMSSLPCWS